MQASPVAADGFVFPVSDAGILSALDQATGAQVWQQRLEGAFSASPVVGRRQALSAQRVVRDLRRRARRRRTRCCRAIRSKAAARRRWRCPVACCSSAATRRSTRSGRHGEWEGASGASIARCFRSSPSSPRLDRVALASPAFAQSPLPRLKVSDNKRFLVTADGKPFFWLGDTAWELFHRLNREDAEKYLKNRAERRFTVVQAVVLAELDGLNDPNAYGERPLVGQRPAQAQRGATSRTSTGSSSAPTRSGSTSACSPHGATSGTRSGAWAPRSSRPPMPRRTASGWGAATRMPASSGSSAATVPSSPPRTSTSCAPWHAACARATAARTCARFIRPAATARPPGFTTTTGWTSTCGRTATSPEFTGRYDMTRADYDRTPVKPVVDAEPIYEDHPVAFDAKKFGHSIGGDVRRPLYWDLFDGAFGHTYGHHSVWQMWSPAKTPINNPLMPWYEAIDQPGAAQMQHARALLESRPFLTRIPDPEVIVTGAIPTSVPGHRPVSLRRHARFRGQLRDGLRAGGPDLQREDERHQRPDGEGVVVQSRAPARRPPSARSPTRASARSRRRTPARCSTGCWCSTMRRRDLARQERSA